MLPHTTGRSPHMYTFRVFMCVQIAMYTGIHACIFALRPSPTETTRSFSKCYCLLLFHPLLTSTEWLISWTHLQCIFGKNKPKGSSSLFVTKTKNKRNNGDRGPMDQPHTEILFLSGWSLCEWFANIKKSQNEFFFCTDVNVIHQAITQSSLSVARSCWISADICNAVGKY